MPCDLKLNDEAPQTWQVALPADTWTASSSTGGLATPVSIKLPEDEGSNQLHFTLNLMACAKDTCVPLKLSVVFDVHRRADAPAVVAEEKTLLIEKRL